MEKSPVAWNVGTFVDHGPAVSNHGDARTLGYDSHGHKNISWRSAILLMCLGSSHQPRYCCLVAHQFHSATKECAIR